MQVHFTKNRFQKNSGSYICLCCGKKTRDTGHDEASCCLCKKCYEEALEDNTKDNQ